MNYFTCERCGEAYALRDDMEPTRYCYECVHTCCEELKAEVNRLSRLDKHLTARNQALTKRLRGMRMHCTQQAAWAMNAVGCASARYEELDTEVERLRGIIQRNCSLSHCTTEDSRPIEDIVRADAFEQFEEENPIL